VNPSANASKKLSRRSQVEGNTNNKPNASGGATSNRNHASAQRANDGAFALLVVVKFVLTSSAQFPYKRRALNGI
jgi:hypothetical protein